MPSLPEAQAQYEPEWREILTHGPRGLLTRGPQGYRLMRWMLRRMPSNPRCKNCYVPFAGIGRGILRLFGFGRSRKNPTMCDF